MIQRSKILHWVDEGHINPSQLDEALQLAEVKPDVRAWRGFFDTLLLLTGSLSLVISLIFFFAYNWDVMGRFTQFGLVELLIVIALVGYWRWGEKSQYGGVTLLIASILLGALLALYGQTYQTGADTWQLFANWAILILSWVLIARFAALWIIWITLCNLSIILYFSVFNGVAGLIFAPEIQNLIMLTFNTLALVFWEWGRLHFDWLNKRWATRLLALASGCLATWIGLLGVFEWEHLNKLTLLCYPLWIGGMFFVYRRLQDLFILSGLCLSLIIVTTGGLGRILLHDDWTGSFLLIAIAVIAMSSVAASWLKRINGEQGNES